MPQALRRRPWGRGCLRPVRREAECPACVWGWPCLASFSLPDGPWGPCGGRGCSLWRRFEELACFLHPWGPCEHREKLIDSPSFLNSIQHVYGAQHPPFDPLVHGT